MTYGLPDEDGEMQGSQGLCLEQFIGWAQMLRKAFLPDFLGRKKEGLGDVALALLRANRQKMVRMRGRGIQKRLAARFLFFAVGQEHGQIDRQEPSIHVPGAHKDLESVRI